VLLIIQIIVQIRFNVQVYLFAILLLKNLYFEHYCRWVREFLDEENQGLDALIDYLSFRLLMMRHEQRLLESHTSSEEKLQTSKELKREKIK